MSQGQINRGSRLGDLIYNLVESNNFNNIVEIGTWNGLGSTKVIRDAIKPNCQFYSVEASSHWYSEALKHNDPIPDNVHFILGRIVEFNEIDDKDLTGDEPTWLSEDIKHYEKAQNVLNLLPLKIDLLLLDGGEFTSFAEFGKLRERTEYIVLDDTKVRKNRIVRKIINNSKKEFTVLHDVKDDRNGFMIAKRNITNG